MSGITQPTSRAAALSLRPLDIGFYNYSEWPDPPRMEQSQVTGYRLQVE